MFNIKYLLVDELLGQGNVPFASIFQQEHSWCDFGVMGNRPLFNPPHPSDFMKDLEDVHMEGLSIENAYDQNGLKERRNETCK